MFDFFSGSEKMAGHLRLSCSVVQSIKCASNFFYNTWPNWPFTWVCQDKLILQLVNKVVFLDWLLNFISTSLFDSLLYCSSYKAICIWIWRVCFKIVLEFPIQFLKRWPFLRLCIPALQHDVVEWQWTVRWLRESIIVKQPLDYLSTCHS